VALRLGFLASHGGTNLQAILDACADGTIKAQAAVVISNNSRSAALSRARNAGVATAHLSSATHPDDGALDNAILETLRTHNVELVVLAGYMKKLGPATLAAFHNRVVNIHPALLPRHGGTGLYGEAVHNAVLDSGETESGATVHLVDGEYDHGAVVAQVVVPVIAGDTPTTLATRVLEQEHGLYVDTIRKIATGELVLPDSNSSTA
jgi:phosphoribosylglycinamide formyltransferase 1